jgi:thymidylate kinase
VKVVAVSGVDGSGKSTFVRGLVRMLRDERELDVQAVWLRFNPRATFGEDVSRTVSTLDSRHRGHLVKRLALRFGLRRLWVRAVVALYRRQLRLQLSAVQSADVVVADRFVLDFFADLVRAGLASAEEYRQVTSPLPAAEVTFVLTGEPDVLLSRRDENEDGAAILQQRSLYLALADRAEARVLDTMDPQTGVSVLRELEKSGVLS